MVEIKIKGKKFNILQSEKIINKCKLFCDIINDTTTDNIVIDHINIDGEMFKFIKKCCENEPLTREYIIENINWKVECDNFINMGRR